MRSLAFILLCAALLFPHGIGNEQIQEVGGVRFELGMDLAVPESGQPTVFGLGLHDSVTGEPLAMDSVWLQAVHNGEILFSSTDFRTTGEGPLFFMYAFPAPGTYEIRVSVFHDGTERAASFPVEVSSAPVRLVTLEDVLFWIVALVLLAISTGLLSRLLPHR